MFILKDYLYLLRVILVLTCAYLLAVLVKQSFFNLTLSDFSTYYYIPKAVLHIARPEHPYSNLIPYYPFFYPPQSIPMFGILSLVPFYIAKYIWTIINVLLAIKSLLLINGFFNKKVGLEFWIMFLGLLVFYPFQFTLRDGQFNIAILFLFVYLAKIIIEKRNILVGVLLSMGIVTKVSPLIVLFYLALKKRYKMVIYTAICILILTIIGEVLVRNGISYYYLRFVLKDVSTQALVPTYLDQSILGFLRRVDIKAFELSGFLISANLIRTFLSYGITLLLTLSLLLWSYKHKLKNNFLLTYCGLVVIGIVGSGLSWFHQYVILLFPLYIVFLNVNRLKTSKRYYLSIVTFLTYLLMYKNLIDTYKGFFQLNLLFGAIIILVLLSYLISIKNEYLEKEVLLEPLKSSTSIWILFIAVFIIALNPFTFNDYLKEGRDRARVRGVDHIAEVLREYKPGFKIGVANSYEKSEKVDEGYILFKSSNGLYKERISLLFLDPINNSKFNYKFESTSEDDFSLSAKLESKYYKNRYGDEYKYLCKSDKCSMKQDIP